MPYFHARFDEALKMHNKALKIRRRALGNDHPDVASSVTGVGSVYGAQGKWEEALERFVEVIPQSYQERTPRAVSSASARSTNFSTHK
jgi:tetratricopeptide (TPR) repeat protein